MTYLDWYVVTRLVASVSAAILIFVVLYKEYLEDLVYVVAFWAILFTVPLLGELAAALACVGLLRLFKLR